MAANTAKSWNRNLSYTKQIKWTRPQATSSSRTTSRSQNSTNGMWERAKIDGSNEKKKKNQSKCIARATTLKDMVEATRNEYRCHNQHQQFTRERNPQHYLHWLQAKEIGDQQKEKKQKWKTHLSGKAKYKKSVTSCTLLAIKSRHSTLKDEAIT